MSDHPPFTRFDHLSRSSSGLHYVRDRSGGVMRVLTDSELADFNDPPPCADCGEQFGCEHINCAGEPLMTDPEIESEVPAEWLAFARENRVSRPDLERLGKVEHVGGEYRVATGTAADMRLLELVLLLNDSR